MRTPLLATAFATLLLAAGVAQAGAAAGAPTYREDDDKLVLANDHVTVWFEDKRPVLVVFPTLATLGPNGSAPAGAFGYAFKSLVEYRDLDANGVPADHEVVARLDLDNASWNITHVATSNEVVLNLTLAREVKLTRGGVVNDLALPDRVANVTLLFTMRAASRTVETGVIDLDVPATSLGWELVVTQWPFVDAQQHRLALETSVAGLAERAAGDVTAAGVSVNETEVGMLAWAPTANATVAAASVEAPVKAHLAQDAETNRTRVAFTYDAPGVSALRHAAAVGLAPDAAEPVVGASERGVLGAAARDVPGLGVVAVVGALGALAVALGGRRSS